MYTKKNIINRKKKQNNYLKGNKKAGSLLNSAQRINQKNYLTYREDESNSFNNDYLNLYYKNPIKMKNNLNKFYVKKTQKIINDINKNIERNDYQKNYIQSLSQGRIQKQKNIIYNISQINSNSNSNSKINEFDYSTNLSKGSILENFNNYNYNISGYNTINNVGIEIKLDNNTCSSINSNYIKKSITNGINKYNAKPPTNYFIFQNRMKSKRDNIRKNYLYKSNPDLNKFLNLIKDDNQKNNTYIQTYTDKNKFGLNSRTNNIINSDTKNGCLKTDLGINKQSKKRVKSYNNNDMDKIKKEIEYRKNEFEKMRSIEKKIKKYFIENGVSFKNRELYHQSAIIIQSNLRAFIVRKKMKFCLKYDGIIDMLKKIFYKKKSIYFKTFLENIDIYNNNLDNNEKNQINRNLVNNNFSKLKVEILNNFSIINNSKINPNKQFEEENKLLKTKLNELEIQIQKLKKENEKYKNPPKQNINKIIPENKIDNLKMKENIENVTKELEEMNLSKKKNDNLNLVYNLRNYININNKNYNRPNTINRQININDNRSKKDYKLLFLKYLITLNIIKSNASKKLNFNKFVTNIKIKDLNEIIQINRIKQFIDIIKNRIKQNIYHAFYKIYFTYYFSKIQRSSLHPKNIIFRNTTKTKIKK